MTKALSVVIIRAFLFSSLKGKLSPAFRFPLNEVAEKETVLWGCHHSAQWCCTLHLWDNMASDRIDQFEAFLKLPHMVECGYFSGLFFDKNSPSIMGRGWLDNQPKLIYSFLMWCIPWDMSKLCSGDIEYILSQSLYLMYRVKTKMWAVLLVIWPCRKYMLWISL